MGTQRRFCSLRPVWITTAVLTWAPIAPSIAQSQDTPVDPSEVRALERQMADLRSNAEYKLTIPLAERIVAMIESSENASIWELDDARRRVVTLTRIASLSSIDQCAFAESDRALAERDFGLISRAVDTRSRLLGRDHPETLAALNAMADLNLDRGQIADAELILRRAIEALRRELGKAHPATLHCMTRLAIVTHYQGRFDESVRMFRQIVELRRRFQGRDHIDTRGAEVNLARMLYELERYAESEAHYAELLTWFQRRYGESHPITLNCMGSLGCAMRAQGKLNEAERLLRRRVEIERRDNQDPLDDVDGLHALAMLLLAKGPLDEAEAVCLEAIDAHKRLKKPEDHKLVSLLNALAEIQYARGRFADAEATWRRSADVFELVRGRIGHSGFERIRFTAEASPFFRLAACLARNEKPVEAWRRLEQGLARGLIDAVGADADRLTDDERTERLRLLSAISAAEETIAVESEDEPDETRDSGNGLRERNARRAALLEFDTRMATIHGAPSSHPFELHRIQANLPERTAIIAWIDNPTPPGSSSLQSEHYACVLRRNGDPAWVRLRGHGDNGAWTAQDTSLAHRVSSDIALRPTARVGLDADLDALRVQRLKPVEYLLDGITHLIALPVGDMGRVPLQALTQAYSVSYAPSATVFARLVERDKSPDTPHPRRTLLALGDPIYAQTNDAAQRLVGSGHEVRSIAQFFDGASSESTSAGGATLLLGPDATETALQRLATNGSLRRYGYIHLSAHGLLDDFLPWRSSLLLSSSTASETTTPVYDDRLSAGQIAQTWRLNAELVTLSACETALGRSEGGEGFVGFSQALFASGARSLALSLWKVDDAATALLMSRFYENLTGSFSDERHVPGAAYPASQPMPKCDALVEAKQWLRTNTPDQNKAALQRLGFNLDGDAERLASERGGIRISGERPQVSYDYSDPHYWAAFVLSGDPN